MGSPALALGALAVGLLVVGAIAPTAGLSAQGIAAGGDDCELVRSVRLNYTQRDGQQITYIDGPVLFECVDGTAIQADSVVDFTTNRFRQLYGGVTIDGPEMSLRAERMNISDATGLTQAWGGVEASGRESEIRMVGDSLEFREASGARPESVLIVMGRRPYAVLRLQGAPRSEGADSTASLDLPESAEPQAPDTVFADRLMLLGEERFLGLGSVEVRRPDLLARGDSLDYDRTGSTAVLVGGPDGKAAIDGDAYDLTARTVDLIIEGDDVTEILAREDARLVGEDVEMEAPRIRIFLAAGEMDRLIALGDPPPAPDSTAEAGGGGDAAEVAEDPPPRRQAVALAEDFLLRADSVEVIAPDQSLQEVVAVGRARGESMAQDSLNNEETPELIRRDWIEGDTVVAHFVPSGQGDTAEAGDPSGDGAGREYSLDRLVASGGARSLYRMAPRDSTRAAADTASDTASVAVAGGEPGAMPDSTALPPPRDRLAVHYVTGRRITIFLSDGEVERMEVQGQTQGIYLEPRRSGAPAPAMPQGLGPGSDPEVPQ